ncbi:MAG: bifunctional adenosylcobinamide kinase/adenosylcobinamide-phosphate guanylyltransferase [Clostridiales bacterium]|nr:bifunctional adenosylcobinamide kinase/adenosylcobinamide-phosphate guanylyltransferase [Clostridiales bacterium]
MILVIGGAYQGKLDFAIKTYGITDGWIDGRDCEFSQITSCRGIHHFHDYIKRMTVTPDSAVAVRNAGNSESAGWNFGRADLTTLEGMADQFACWLFGANPELVIVSNELGYGIVPMEKQDRLWREAVGRVCTSLAARSDEVVRVVCGIGSWLKRPCEQ